MSKDIFSKVGALLGLVSGGGNPIMAAVGSGIGSLLGGGSMQDAFESGIGSLFTAGTTGKVGLALDMFAKDAGPSGRGKTIMDMFSQNEGKRKQAEMMMAKNMNTGFMGGDMGPGGGILNNMFDPNSPVSPILQSLAINLRTQNRNPMTDLEKAQFATGERRPDFRGVALPDTPTVVLQEGGMIQGPGTGKSDSIKSMIYQNGQPVQEARLSDGEFVMTADAVKGAGNGDRAKGAAKMYQMMNRFEGMA